MTHNEFQLGLNTFAERHAAVQQKLNTIEQQGLMRNQVDNYRALLDELVVIAKERADYCSQSREQETRKQESRKQEALEAAVETNL